MSPEFWKEIESVFESACELPVADRVSFLAQRCADAPELRAEVERLLLNDEKAGGFMEAPVWTGNLMDSSIKHVISNSFGESSNAATDFAGLVVGPYRLSTEIGHGGMGTVYLGERIDGEFTQEVAVKLLKRGLDSDFVIKRFRHERQILASFEHPFISRLLDGGTTEDGIPYFVMEYVRGGVTIYDWCDSRKLDIRSRLRLFIKVCSALEYAHERKIVHRDIKPNNILVNPSGAPKLLDFGIAKILDPNLIHESFYPTASLVRMMTPDYASPEQIRGLEITPSSDIYSIGVLLYELVTGHRPYKLTQGMNELSAVVCEVKPNEPSKTLLDHSTLMKRYMSAENAADVRSTEVDDFAGILKVLDPIVLKALEKDPADRFPHIEAFIESLNEVVKGKQLTATRSTIDQPAATQNGIGQRSVAILPFRTIVFAPGVNTTDEQFLGVGLADALIARLGRINKFLVLPTSSIRTLREGTNDPIRTGRQLKVDYVLDGNIKLAGDRLRLSVQLLDVKGNAAIWATSIDEKTGDLFSLEETLSSQLIEALVPRISSSDLAHYLRRGTEEPDAFEDYIRGRYHFGLMTEEHLAKSFLLFHRAIAADPNYAHAYCGIANYYNWLGVIGVLPPADCFPPAIEAAKKAVELDPSLSEAHASLGFSLHVGIFDWEKPELHFKKAIELNPNNANACLWYSTFLFMAGRFETGFEYAYKAAELDRLSPYSHYNIGSGLYYARRFKEAEAQHQKVVDEFPDYGLGYYGLARIYRYLGKSDLAIETNNRAAELLDNSTLVQISTAESLAAAGNLDETAEKLTELAELAKKRFVSPYMLSMVYSFLNDHEMVLNLLERSLELGEAWLCCASVEARFESLFDNDRFQSILKAVNHPMTQSQKMLSSAGQNTGSFSDRTTVLIDKVA